MQSYKNSEQASNVSPPVFCDNLYGSGFIFFTRFQPPFIKGVIRKFLGPFRKIFPPATFGPTGRHESAFRPGAQNILQGYIPFALRVSCRAHSFSNLPVPLMSTDSNPARFSKNLVSYRKDSVHGLFKECIKPICPTCACFSRQSNRQRIVNSYPLKF